MIFSVSGHSLLKDVVVAFSVLVATVGCWMAVLQKRKAKEQMERMMKDMKILQQAEDGLQELQTRYKFFWKPLQDIEVHWPNGWHAGAWMILGSAGFGHGHYVVFLGNTLYSHSASFHPVV